MEILCRWWALSKPWELWVQAVGLVWQAPALWIPDTAQLYWKTKLKIEKAHPACKKFSCIYFSIYTFENGRQSSFPCFFPYSAFEACFRNSWSPTWILALPPFLSPTSLCPFWVRYYIPHSSVSQTRDIVGKSCLKLAFPFPHFEISAFLWFFFHAVLCCLPF